MTGKDRANNLAEIIEGNDIEATGQAASDDRLVADRSVNQTKGNFEQVGEKTKDSHKVDSLVTS